MIIDKRVLIFLALLVSISACVRYAPNTNQPDYNQQSKKSSGYPDTEPEVDRSRKKLDVKTYPYQDATDSRYTKFPKLEKPLSPAVISLLSQADQSYKSGDYGHSVATIERALRIEPRNATLVYKLAAVRLKQSKPRLAEDLAKKASLLAGNNTLIKRRSWLLISEARRVQGNQFGANEAKQKAAEY